MIKIQGRLTGYTFFNISMDTWGRIRVGMNLELKRDTDNKYDKNAIQVLFEGKQIAWVEKSNAAILAPLLDEGKTVEAKTTRIFGDPEDRPHIEVDYKLCEYSD